MKALPSAGGGGDGGSFEAGAGVGIEDGCGLGEDGAGARGAGVGGIEIVGEDPADGVGAGVSAAGAIEDGAGVGAGGVEVDGDAGVGATLSLLAAVGVVGFSIALASGDGLGVGAGSIGKAIITGGGGGSGFFCGATGAGDDGFFSEPMADEDGSVCESAEPSDPGRVGVAKEGGPDGGLAVVVLAAADEGDVESLPKLVGVGADTDGDAGAGLACAFSGVEEDSAPPMGRIVVGAEGFAGMSFFASGVDGGEEGGAFPPFAGAAVVVFWLFPVDPSEDISHCPAPPTGGKVGFGPTLTGAVGLPAAANLLSPCDGERRSVPVEGFAGFCAGLLSRTDAPSVEVDVAGVGFGFVAESSLIPTLRVGVSSATLRTASLEREEPGRGASELAFPRGAWERGAGFSGGVIEPASDVIGGSAGSTAATLGDSEDF